MTARTAVVERTVGADRLPDRATALRGPVITRRAARPADEGYVRDLVTDRHDELLILSPDVRDLMLETRYRDWRELVAARHPGAVHEILGRHGADVGHLVLDAGPRVVRVVDLVVHRAARRHGVGAAVVVDLIAEAGARPVRVSLGHHDTAGRALCRSLGFTETNEGARITLEHRPA